jgi:fumarate hydratase class II
MVCFQVLGNDKTIELAAQRSNFELNVMCPIIMYNILQSIEILTNEIKTFKNLCLKNLKVNKKRVQKQLENSLCTATALTPYIGYDLTAEIVKSALKKNITIKEEALRRKIFTKKELDEILSIKAITNPSVINQKLIKKFQE